jgi:hypothetical protein
MATPPEMPLTTEDSGTTVYVVIHDSDDLWIAGVYYSLERACAYIIDWLTAGDLPCNPAEIPEFVDDHWLFNGYQLPNP